MWRALFALMFGAILAVALVAFRADRWLDGGPPIYGAQDRAAEDVVVTVASGSGIATVAGQLQQAGYLAHPRVWQLYARWRGLDGDLKAGTYRLTADASPRALLRQLVVGEVIRYSVVLLEGSRVDEVLRALQAAPGLKQTLTNADAASILEMLELPGGHGEGRFFPDTYRYQHGDSDRLLLRQAHARMAETLETVWRDRAEDVPLASPDELLIMASIIEKETGAAADRARISQVFARRLKLGMRLQTDPTVIYGLGNSFDGNLKRVHLRTDTPYNSYTRHGLPPTPIALPGLASLEAAAHPADGEYLYFVSRGDGSSEFSKTLEAHNAAVRRYQLNQRSNAP